MKKTILLFVFLLLSGANVIHANKHLLKKADEQYKNKQYFLAIQTYEKIANMFEIADRLGDCYYFNANYDKAVKWYENLLSKSLLISVEPEYYRRYSLCLKAMEQYDKANEYLKKYYQEKGENNPKIDTYLKEIENNSYKYEVENVTNLNSEFSDYSVAFYNNYLLFTSSRKTNSMQKLVDWNNQPFSSFYVSEKDEQNNFKEPVPILEELSSELNESTLVFTKDKQTVYFTRNSYPKGKGMSLPLLKIYSAKLKNGKWTKITELPFNSDEYNVAHPALSADEKTLYFASDMPGSLGQTDIWKVSINENQTFGKPENLGPTINTEGKESFPFISQNNILYYASDGKLGLGGLDIFSSKITESDTYQEAVNIGKPINSSMDDFAFYIDTQKATGFFSSNRKGGIGADDIYQFITSDKLISGAITDSNNGEIISMARVKLLDEKGKVLASTTTDHQGRYRFDRKIVGKNTKGRIRVESPYHSTVDKFVDFGEKQLNFGLKSAIFEPKVGENLGITSIYFDTGKDNINVDAAIELSKILRVLQDYPKLKLEIRSHTDSNGSASNNQKLSEKRAKSTRKWLIHSGINSDRLTAKGFGETQLVNHCSDGVECSEEEHFANRRSEFIVTEVEKK